MRCPQCGQINPISITRCDCGYDLQMRPGGRMQESFLSRNEGTIGCLSFIAVCVLCMWVAGCFVPNKEPVRIMQRELDKYPEYSVIVEDVEDGWFSNYISLRGTYRKLESINDQLAEEEIKEGEEGANKELEAAEPILDTVTRKYQVRDSMIRRYEPYVGMVVASKVKKGGKTEVTGIERASPASYHYVGRRRYGYWMGSRWMFYPRYRPMFGYYGRPSIMISRSMYGSYRSHYSTRRPYYGRTTGGRTMYGSRGSVTAKANPSFVNRYKSKTGSSYSRSGASSSRSSSSRSSSSRSSGGFFSRFSSSRSGSSRSGFSSSRGK